MQQQPLKSTRLLDQLRERIRYAHYSLHTLTVCFGKCYIDMMQARFWPKAEAFGSTYQ